MESDWVKKGFTLVELLVVMAIVGLISTLAISSFRSSQIKGRDVQRKSNLRETANALEAYFSDYGRYPAASNGLIVACLPPSGTIPIPCTWGVGDFTDSKATVYIKRVPKDPVSGARQYVYRVSTLGDKYQLYAALENTDDNAYDTGISGLGLNCGASSTTYICNYAVASGSTTTTETLL